MAKKAAPKAAETKAPAAAEKKAERPKGATKGEVFSHLAEKTGLSKKDVASVFEALSEFINKELGKKGPGVFTLPGLLKLQVVRKPATKAKQVPNPFKPGEMMTVKAKPARNAIKARPLKSLKESV